jgi:dipeptidyl aminopeptidase/acylaminoacyl peptidase
MIGRKLPIILGLLSTGLSAQAPVQAASSPTSWDPQQVLRTEKYVHPPALIERVITAPRVDISFTSPSPDRKWFLRTIGPERGDLKYYGKGHINLAGLQIDTLANRARTVTMKDDPGIELVDPRTGNIRALDVPKGVTVTAAAWSPTGNQVAYIGSTKTASHVFVADAASGKSTQITKTPLLATLVTTIEWAPDGKSIVAVLVPDNRGTKPTHGDDDIEDGPQVRFTEGKKMPQVIHPALLEDPHDKALLVYYTTGQLASIDVKTKAVKKIGSPTMIRTVDISPDGQFLRVTRLVEPFSYRVPIGSFGSEQEVWDASGKMLVSLNKTPLRENEQTGDDVPAAGGRGGQPSAADPGKRNIQWNPAGPGLVYLESVFSAGRVNDSGAGSGRAGRAGGAAAAGRGGAGANARPQPTAVRYVSWAPPFGAGDTKVLYEGSPRLASVAYSVDAKTMFVADSGTVFAIRMTDPSKKFNLGRGVSLPGGGGFGGGGRGGFTRRGQGGGGGVTTVDSVGTGGALAMRTLPNHASAVVMASDNKSVYLSGTRAFGANWRSKGPRPWVDRIDIESGQRTRVFDAPADAYEQFITALDDDYSQFIYTHETPTVIADAYLRDAKAGTSKKLTNNKDVAPEITGAVVKQLAVTRQRDNFTFLVDVTLPKDWKPGVKLPGVLWFYPREFMSQADYDRVQYGTNINRFPEVPTARPASTMQLWVGHGYALIEPDLPIVGDSGKMNDNYTRDLRETLDAVVDAVVEAGYVDRNRLGIGGHSYGAFSTVNAMTLVPYFKAGIAGDGMYNRSLTPFGFQSERRNFYDAQATYLDMSPFFRADKLSGALLLYHSLEDQNVGTAPISSIRMLHALQGLGKTAAMYMYPYEDHSVAMYQTDLDQWARWLAWFDVYVKGAKAQSNAALP